MIFRLEYKNRDGLQARLDITTPGSSVVKEIEGAENPFVLSYKGDKSDKSFHFMTSSAEINIYETPEFNIDRLKTSSETQIKVDYYIDDDKYWEGFVIPDFFSREIGGAGVVSMSASDRLSTLKGVTLSDLPAMVQIRDLAVRCLAKTGLNLTLKTMADFRANELGFNEYFRSEITSQRLYDSKGRSISCYDILKSILVTSGSTLRQRGGEWHIINKLQHEAGAGRVYSTENTSVNYVESVHHFDEIVKGARRTIIPVAGSVGIYHEYGGGKLHPDNYDFSQGLTGWTPVGGFEMGIEDRQVKGYKQPTPGYPLWEPDLGDVTGKNKLANIKNESAGFSGTSLNERPYVKATVPLVYADNTSSIEVSANISITSQLNNSVVWVLLAEKGTTQLGLTLSGSFEPFVPTEDKFKHRISVGGEGVTENPAEVAYDVVVLKKGTLSQESLSGFSVTLRIYGSGPSVTSFVNFASLSFRSTQEIAKGVIYKRDQGSDFTKMHDIDTVVFGDYLTGGLNGFFYDYPIDDTSSLSNPYSGISSLWTTPYFPTETEALPLLQHVVRQQARMFSVAHDLISGEIEMSEFDPLSIFTDCNGKRHVIVSASFDFLRSSAKVELEEIAYANLTVRDFIYSYFGDGESGIKSVGGISGGVSGGGTGGGLTPEQLEILSWWKKDPDNPDTIFTEMNAYSTKELSAYGLGEGSGGGGGSDYERLDTWADYDSSKSGWVLSAFLGNDLNTRVADLENGSALSVNTTGTGDVLVNASKSGNIITLTKGNQTWANLSGKPSTFAPSPHTHAISDVTGLQMSLDDKYNTPSGTASQYIKGDGSLGAFPSIPQGTVTSVGISVPTGLSVSNSPITSSGVIAIGLQAGYSIPTTVKQGQWDTAYGWGDHSPAGYYNIKNITGYISSITDFNDAVAGTRGLGNTQANMPTSGFNDVVTISQFNTADLLQIVYPFRGDGKFYMRNRGGAIDTWSPWLRIWHSGNIPQAEVTNWREVRTWWQNVGQYLKRDATNQALYTDENFYSTKELSAYGIGSGGGSGSGIIETVYGYGNLGQTFNNSILTDTFNAYTINQINTRLVAVEGGSALTVNTTGTGNAITSISKAGSVITADKGLTFSLSTHLHTGVYEPAFTKNSAFNKNFGTTSGTVAEGNDSRIINGQTAFGWGNHATAGYALNSAFNTHNNDNVRHITGAERTKWDAVVTDFDNLEIGGRNLVKGSGVEITGTGRLRGYTLSEPLIYGETYTATFKAKKGEGARFKLWLNNNITDSGLNLDNNDPNEIIIKSHTFTFTGSETNANLVSIYSELSSNPSTIYWLKIEKCTKPTDWTPAPEDQVSDWNTTDVNSFSFIKNKPTLLSQFTDNIGVATHIANKSNPHNVTKAQVGLGNVDNTADSVKNVLSATKLTNARTIAGVSFDGSANIAIPFANLSSKPTTLGGYGITDAVTLNTAQTITGAKTFDANITLGVNRYIQGTDSYTGVWNVDNKLWRFGSSSTGSISNIRSEKVGIGTDSPAYKLDVNGTGRFTGALTAAVSVASPKVIFNAAGWSLEQVGSELQMKHNNVLKMRFTSTGSIVATEEITAFG